MLWNSWKPVSRPRSLRAILTLGLLGALAMPVAGEPAAASEPAGASQPAAPAGPAADLAFKSGTLEGWTAESNGAAGDAAWSVEKDPEINVQAGDPSRFVATSLTKGEKNTGKLRSPVFTIDSPIQTFTIAGWDGTLNGRNDGEKNFVFLRSSPDGAVLRRAHVPGGNKLTPVRWITADLIGRAVTVEVVDDNPVIQPGGFAWIAFADYQQQGQNLKDPVKLDALYALPLDEKAELTVCRTLPFLVAHPGRRGQTKRQAQGDDETIPVGTSAETVYLLGMTDYGWDCGVAHWGEHPELRTKRDDQVFIGSKIGEIEIRYADGTSDRVPVEMGATAWFYAQWVNGPSHGVPSKVQEPFASRPELREIFTRSLRLHASEDAGFPENEFAYYYLALKPKAKPIASIVVHDNPGLRGRPLVSAVTLDKPGSPAGLKPLGPVSVERADTTVNVDVTATTDVAATWRADVDALAGALYTGEADLPKKVDLLDFPAGVDAARIRFLGDPANNGGIFAGMLSNIWVQNLMQMNEKFVAATGVFNEDGKTSPWYGGYSGIGTWGNVGVYFGAGFARCSDHYATVALRGLNNAQRWTSYVDYCDHALYLFRKNHDPKQGPENGALDISRIPEGMPPHWTMSIGGIFGPEMNEIPGNEETDGTGATLVGRWMAWRLAGAPKGEWLTAPREKIYGHSRWEATRDAANFLCWLMDYTGRDVMYNEGETTGWGGPNLCLLPPGMVKETDPVKIKQNYANADVYEPYPTWVCAVALRCSAQMAETAGDPASAKKYRQYADRLQAGMRRLLTNGDHNKPMWRVAPFSVYASLQDSLVPAWFALYLDGYDPQRWNADLTRVTRNTLDRQLAQPYGHAAVLAMGYGQGWLTKAALLLDEMGDAGPLLINIAKYTWDKNMDWADPARKLDWRQYEWLIPEGTNILPDGRWYRIGDLTNGANQGPAMHALEVCAGVDDTDPAALKIIPRVPDPLTGIEISRFLTLVPNKEAGTDKTLAVARLDYTYEKGKRFTLKADRPLPTLAVRLGPFASKETAEKAQARVKPALPASAKSRVEQSGHLTLAEERTKTKGEASKGEAYWLWVEALANTSALDLALGD